MLLHTCGTHLVNTQAQGTEIESVITKFLLIYVCGAYEKTIKKLIVERAAKTNDTEVTSFIESIMKTHHNFMTSDIKGLLNRFSDNYKIVFATKIENTEAETRYNNIIQNRHRIAHGEDINITFSELVESYNKAEAVLDAIREAIKP